jgi:hypothetical protein
MTWSVTLWEEHRLRFLGNRLLRKKLGLRGQGNDGVEKTT